MKLVILDRDGVINYDSKDYIKHVDEWRPIPGSLEAIARLSQAGILVAVATNQSGIARRYYCEQTLADIHQKMQQAIRHHGGVVDKIVYCPHHPDDKCYCRKPSPGMLIEIATHFDIDLNEVPFIGDRQSDIECAKSCGAKPILIHSEMTNVDGLDTDIARFHTLSDAIDDLLS